MILNRYPKEVILKDETEVIIKTVNEEDIDLLVQFFRRQDITFSWYLKEDPCDPNVIRKWIESQKEGRSFTIVGMCQGEIISHAALLLRPHGARRHIGRIRIMVDPRYKRKRLGTWMLFDLIKRAMELGLERIRIDFVVGIDDDAIEAVRKLDFIKEGLLKDYIKDEKGQYHDYVIMVKQLHKEWGDF